MRKKKKLEKEIKEIDKELKKKKIENEELQHMLLTRINSDIKSIGKLINPIVNGLTEMDERLKKLEEKQIDDKIDKVVDDMFS